MRGLANLKFPAGAWGKYFAIPGNFHLQKTYIANGDYQEQVSASALWFSGPNTAALNDKGSPGPNEFSVKAAYSSKMNGENSPVLVTASPNYVTIDDNNIQTDEFGDTVATNSLWIRIGSQLADLPYSGIVYYCITR